MLSDLKNKFQQYNNPLKNREVYDLNDSRKKFKQKLIFSLGGLALFLGIPKVANDVETSDNLTIPQKVDFIDESVFMNRLINTELDITELIEVFDDNLFQEENQAEDREINDNTESLSDYYILDFFNGDNQINAMQLNSFDYLTFIEPVSDIQIDIETEIGVNRPKTENDNHFISESEKNNLIQQAGIKPDDYQYVDYIIQRESNWRPFVWNQQGSSAYGLCQSMQSVWKDTWADDFMTNPVSQLKWCNWYAFDRYGSWQKAYEFWKQNHWW